MKIQSEYVAYKKRLLKMPVDELIRHSCHGNEGTDSKTVTFRNLAIAELRKRLKREREREIDTVLTPATAPKLLTAAQNETDLLQYIGILIRAGITFNVFAASFPHTKNMGDTIVEITSKGNPEYRSNLIFENTGKLFAFNVFQAANK